MPDDRLIHRAFGHSEKINSLTDFERLVWLVYKVASDDYGVMRFSAVTLQEAARFLEQRTTKIVLRALEAVRDAGLIQLFTHQNRDYCYQWDWQTWQKITHPRQTKQPAPPLELCDANTRWLLSHHPVGGKLKSWRAPGLHPVETGSKPEATPGLHPVETSPVFVGSGCVSGERKNSQREDGMGPDERLRAIAYELREIYPEVYAACRAGAVYRTTHAMAARDNPKYYALAELYPDIRKLREMLKIFLTRPLGDKASPGSPGQFLNMAPECDEVLRRSGWKATA
jgi:hypothetical protein